MVEEGIRGAQESCGVVDVCKRQVLGWLLVGWFLFGWSVGWLIVGGWVGWLVGLLVGRMVVLSVGRLLHHSAH